MMAGWLRYESCGRKPNCLVKEAFDKLLHVIDQVVVDVNGGDFKMFNRKDRNPYRHLQIRILLSSFLLSGYLCTVSILRPFKIFQWAGQTLKKNQKDMFLLNRRTLFL